MLLGGKFPGPPGIKLELAGGILPGGKLPGPPGIKLEFPGGPPEEAGGLLEFPCHGGCPGRLRPPTD